MAEIFYLPPSHARTISCNASMLASFLSARSLFLLSVLRSKTVPLYYQPRDKNETCLNESITKVVPFPFFYSYSFFCRISYPIGFLDSRPIEAATCFSPVLNVNASVMYG